MLAAAERWGGGEDERPFLPRALSVLRTGSDGLEFMLEDVGPGTRRLCELQAGDGLWVTGPLGHGFEPRSRRRSARRPVRRRSRHRAAGDPPGCAARRRAPGAGPAGLSRRRPRPRGGTAARRPGGDRRRLGRAPRARHRPARRGARRGPAQRRSSRAARRRCSKPSAHSARSAASRCSWRWRPGWRAASARASAAWCPVRGGGYLRVCVDGPVVDGERLDTCLVAGAGH